MLNMLVGIYIGIAIMGAIAAAVSCLSAPGAASKKNTPRTLAPAMPREKVTTAPVKPDRPASLIAGIKKRLNWWQRRIHNKKIIISSSPPPSIDASEELPKADGTATPEPNAAAPDLLENMPPLPLDRERLAPASATEESAVNIPDAPVTPAPEMTIEKTTEETDPAPAVPDITPVAVDSAVPDEERAVTAVSELYVTDSSPVEPTPEMVPFAAASEAETETTLPELAAIELPLEVQNNQQISEEEPEMNMSDGNMVEPVEATAEDQSPEESEGTGEPSDEKDQKRPSSGKSIFDLFTDEVAEESEISKFAATLDDVDVHDLLNEAQDFKNKLGGTQG